MPDPVHWSLAFFKAKGYTVSVFCPNMHGADIDLDAAIARFGPDLIIPDHHDRFVQTFRCKVCGQRGLSLSIQPPDVPTAGGGHRLS